MFKDIIENNEEDVSKDDINLAIYYHIIYDDIEYAKTLAEKSIEKYPKEDLFLSYL